ncbi:BrnA antitoxin family protein [Niveispirillum sp. KHB5.9]|uniref:BrnA antitoxin family protein n=1 Tax=Niveispirillum sp. KHB5.9 TaxID=3400269 RepID=UPI003A841CB2
MSYISGVVITAAERAALLRLDEPEEVQSAHIWPPRRPRGMDRRTMKLQLDGDLVDWFRRHGGGDRAMQARINAALRAYMADHDDGE